MDYPRNKPGADVGRLHGELVAEGLPIEYVRGPDASGVIIVTTTVDLDALEIDTMDDVIAKHDGRKRQPRVLYAIWKDIGALSGAQKQNIANDLFSGDPPKVTQDTGVNAPDLLILWTLQNSVSLSTTDKQSAQRSAMSIYTLDNPKYLVHPPFDPTINVPGDEVVG